MSNLLKTSFAASRLAAEKGRSLGDFLKTSFVASRQVAERGRALQDLADGRRVDYFGANDVTIAPGKMNYLISGI